jgi:hypothetical protein
MSIGYEDPKVSYARTGRAPFDETVTVVGGSYSGGQDTSARRIGRRLFETQELLDFETN